MRNADWMSPDLDFSLNSLFRRSLGEDGSTPCPVVPSIVASAKLEALAKTDQPLKAARPDQLRRLSRAG
jgi:hypothetical protein